MKWAFLINCCPPVNSFLSFSASSKEPHGQFWPYLGKLKQSNGDKRQIVKIHYPLIQNHRVNFNHSINYIYHNDSWSLYGINCFVIISYESKAWSFKGINLNLFYHHLNAIALLSRFGCNSIYLHILISSSPLGDGSGL